MSHRSTEPFLSAACGKAAHGACTKLDCTCFCHQNVYQNVGELLDEGNVELVLDLMGLPPIHHDK